MPGGFPPATGWQSRRGYSFFCVHAGLLFLFWFPCRMAVRCGKVFRSDAGRYRTAVGWMVVGDATAGLDGRNGWIRRGR
ncbi:hypothetical protein HMPREF3196_00771 [Bifidobacterium bifidum]|uniref:Uncharacterized protein n=1 Tax=Bifidobacterium bifidum TaxID=1681 RepID=A0A133KQT3_BIFBI|nr:hypothetical protein HMPREF3196_00771 [Bifidobacterium bifidum]